MLYIPHGSDNTKEEIANINELLELYIPHGSDNTSQENWRQISGCMLYIPHGSDNTDVRMRYLSDCIQLYIPHGSDNTVTMSSSSALSRNFISHMVQIIQFFVPIFISPLLSLYPTWFR